MGIMFGMKRIVAVALAFVAVPFATAAAPDSGISGVVRGTACAPPRVCRTSSPPAVTIRVARAADRAPVATTHPRNGRFRVALAPGLYVLTAYRGMTASGHPAQKLQVRVQPHEFTLVVLTLAGPPIR
jgi:hypothetical protein